MLCTVLDEAVPVCLVNQELATQEAAILLEFLIHKQPILNHHSAFLSCSFDHPEQSYHDEMVQESLLTLPYFSSIVHCHLSCNQSLTINQPRFEDGKVSRCIGNSLQLAVYERTDTILFLTGQIEIFDLFETAPKGRIIAVWKVADTMITASCQLNEVRCQDPSVARFDNATKENTPSDAKTRRSSSLLCAKQKPVLDSKQIQQVATSREQTTPPAPVREAGTAVYKVSPLDPLSDHDANPQGTATTKRGLSPLEALVRKVPVPKLPGTVNTCKVPTDKLEQTMLLTSQPNEQFEEQFKEQGRGQIPDANSGKNDNGLLSQVASHPSASTLEQDALLLIQKTMSLTTF